MRYNDRCTVIKIETTQTPLGLEETETSHIMPCSVQNVSFNEQATLYGQTVETALKVHLRGHVSADEFEYQGRRYNITTKRHFRDSTVFYLAGNLNG